MICDGPTGVIEQGICDLCVRPDLPVPFTNGKNAKSSETYEMPTARVILVGGFLGAGKTTLLTQAARAWLARASVWD